MKSRRIFGVALPKTTISFDPDAGVYFFGLSPRVMYQEYEVTVDLKSSTVKRFKRNLERVQQDQEIMKRLFIEAQMAGRNIRER